MAIKFKLEKIGKKTDLMKSAFKKLDKQGTDLGYFANQGKHVGADGIADYTYAGLALALAIGFFPAENITRAPMPFLDKIAQRTLYGMNRHASTVNRAYRVWGSRLEKGGNPLVLLNAVGEFGKEQANIVMGNPAYFPEQPSNKTPLFETGELKSKFTYRTTFDRKVRRT